MRRNGAQKLVSQRGASRDALVDLLDRGGDTGHAGVVHEDVDAPFGGDDRGHDPLDLMLVGHVQSFDLRSTETRVR